MLNKHKYDSPVVKDFHAVLWKDHDKLRMKVKLSFSVLKSSTLISHGVSGRSSLEIERQKHPIK